MVRVSRPIDQPLAKPMGAPEARYRACDNDRSSDRDPVHPAPHLALRTRLAQASAAPSRNRPVRLAALGLLGAAIGIGGAVLGVTLVQAGDGADMLEVVRFDAAQRAARRAAAPQVVYSSYAPQRPSIAQPLGRIDARGSVMFPSFDLNPFIPRGQQPAKRQREARKSNPTATTAYDQVSGAADVARTICVRLCDGYQHPIAHLRDSDDLPGHEALCSAMFPGVPTRVFRVAAGADGIDDAVAADGKTYRSLPMAYAYQTSIDPACARPRRGAETISLMRDFTLRAGDTVMVNGRPRVFNGSTSYPFTSANFRDFRASAQVNASTRRKIDELVGVSRQERLQREARRLSRIREANAEDTSRAVDVLRGGPAVIGESGSAGRSIRVIEIAPR
jgi:Protein of unknown function (DUF2865)